MAIISYDTALRRILKYIKKLRWQPINVYLFHQVSDVFDGSTMKRGDWTETRLFKQNIEFLSRQYRFISLTEAVKRIDTDIFRFQKCAVLTSDDGWESLKNVLPWLNEQSIPITLFVNPCYFDGRHFREKETERYLLQQDIDDICRLYPLVSIGLHGWDHSRVTEQGEEDFRNSIMKSMTYLESLPCFVPFFCFPFGVHNEMSDRVLREFHLTPVLVDNGTNINDSSFIHRILLDACVL